MTYVDLLELIDAALEIVGLGLALPSLAAFLLHLTRQLEVLPWQRWLHTIGMRLLVALSAVESVVDGLQGEIAVAVAGIAVALVLTRFKCSPCHHDDRPPTKRSRLAALKAWLEWQRRGLALPMPA